MEDSFELELMHSDTEFTTNLESELLKQDVPYKQPETRMVALSGVLPTAFVAGVVIKQAGALACVFLAAYLAKRWPKTEAAKQGTPGSITVNVTGNTGNVSVVIQRSDTKASLEAKAENAESRAGEVERVRVVEG